MTCERCGQETNREGLEYKGSTKIILCKACYDILMKYRKKNIGITDVLAETSTDLFKTFIYETTPQYEKAIEEDQTRKAEEKKRQEQLAIEEKQRQAQAAKEAKERQEQEDILNAQLEDIKLSTTQDFNGFTIKAYYGMVFGDVVFRASFTDAIKNFGRNFVGTFGDEKEVAGSMDVLEKSREFAIRKMKLRALELGANAIVGVKSETTFSGSDICHVSLVGTAVRIETK